MTKRGELGITIKLDGNQWFAYRDDFVNVQESRVGFGYTPFEALRDLERVDPAGPYLEM